MEEATLFGGPVMQIRELKRWGRWMTEACGRVEAAESLRLPFTSALTDSTELVVASCSDHCSALVVRLA